MSHNKLSEVHLYIIIDRKVNQFSYITQKQEDSINKYDS